MKNCTQLTAATAANGNAIFAVNKEKRSEGEGERREEKGMSMVVIIIIASRILVNF